MSDRGRNAEACDLLAPFYGWFTEGFGTLDLKETKNLARRAKAELRSLTNGLRGFGFELNIDGGDQKPGRSGKAWGGRCLEGRAGTRTPAVLLNCPNRAGKQR